MSSHTKNNDWFDPNRYSRGIEWKLFGRFLTHYRPHRWRLGLAVILSLVFSSTAYLIPKVFHYIQSALENKAPETLAYGLLGYFAIVMLQGGAQFAITQTKAWMTTRLNQDVLLFYYARLLNSAVPAFLRFKEQSNLFQRVIDAMSTTSQVTDVIVRTVLGGLTVIVFGAVIGSISLPVLGVLLAGTVALGALILWSSPRLRRLRQHVLSINYPLVSRMLEILEGLTTVKALSASVAVTADVEQLVGRKQDAEYEQAVASARVDYWISAVKTVTQLASVSVAFFLLLQGQIRLADLFALYVLINSFLGPAGNLVESYKSLSVLSANLRNYFEVIDIESEGTTAALGEPGAPATGDSSSAPVPALAAASGYGSTPPHGGDGAALSRGDGAAPKDTSTPSLDSVVTPGEPPAPAIEFRNLTFGYDPETPVLKNLNLTIHPGERVALIGRSGAGKTTLVHLLLGFLEPQQGVIRVDGKEISDFPSKDALRRQFGIVGQRDFLFKVSLRDNLGFGLPATPPDAVLEQVLRRVNLWNEVQALPDGLDTVYTKDSFSGGQTQRLFIARALVREPSIVLLDEPTSALDFENEREVARALDHLVDGTTTLTIAHRLSTVQESDRVCVMTEGDIVATGSHQELYDSNDYYRSLCEFNSFIV